MGISLSMFVPSRRTQLFIFITMMTALVTHASLASAQDEITLTVTFVGGGDAIDFGRLRNLESDGAPTTETATRQVRLAIRPSTGNVKPYLVTQILETEPTNEMGNSVSSSSILYRVEQEAGAGTVRVPDQTPMVAGEEEIYQSGPQGGDSDLLITYDLIASSEQEAGSYNGTLDYRVSTI